MTDTTAAVDRLIDQLRAMDDESGNSQGFDAATWMTRWLSEPLPALGGGRPLDLLKTSNGEALVSNLLAQIQSGSYA